MYKALLFDLDDTILSFQKGEEYAIKHLLEYFGIKVSDENIELYSNINLSYWQKLERKEIEREVLIVQRFIDFFKKCPPTLNLDKVNYANDVYFGFLSSVAYEMDGAYETLCTLKKKYKLYLITNGVKRVQDKRLALVPRIKEMFEYRFISEEMGYNKPDAKFMDFVLNVVPYKKEELLIIGDSLTSDIKLGINSGVDTCWLKTSRMMKDGIKPTLTINKITDLIKIL